MSFNLRNRSLLDLKDFPPRAIRFLLDLAAELKRSKYAGNELPRLKGKNIALIFEKASTRTRCAFEVAVHDQGGHVTYIDPAPRSATTTLPASAASKPPPMAAPCTSEKVMTSAVLAAW